MFSFSLFFFLFFFFIFFIPFFFILYIMLLILLIIVHFYFIFRFFNCWLFYLYIFKFLIYFYFPFFFFFIISYLFFIIFIYNFFLFYIYYMLIFFFFFIFIFHFYFFDIIFIFLFYLFSLFRFLYIFFLFLWTGLGCSRRLRGIVSEWARPRRPGFLQPMRPAMSARIERARTAPDSTPESKMAFTFRDFLRPSSLPLERDRIRHIVLPLVGDTAARCHRGGISICWCMTRIGRSFSTGCPAGRSARRSMPTRRVAATNSPSNR